MSYPPYFPADGHDHATTDFYDNEQKEDRIERRLAGGMVSEESSEQPVVAAHETPSAIQPGQQCPTCERRVPHPRKQSSPTSKTVSYRVPLDEYDAYEVIAGEAAKFLGVFEQPFWRFKLSSMAYYLVTQDESLRGFANRDAA